MKSYFGPAVAVGIRDVVGTGRFGSEYIVASKAFGHADVSIGIGWGRLAGNGVAGNPLVRLSERFSRRDPYWFGRKYLIR